MEKKSSISVWLMVLLVFLCCVQERAADDSKEVEGFQQLLLARTQVNIMTKKKADVQRCSNCRGGSSRRASC